MVTPAYLGDTIEECSFYGRDWDRDIEDPAKDLSEMSGCT